MNDELITRLEAAEAAADDLATHHGATDYGQPLAHYYDGKADGIRAAIGMIRESNG